ncbi:hypothetical protein [Vibrio navarrensis]|uniref:hypothetical protein n=1 Tax=Vibrio navarrensis TaxID=29495 RepID=UPI0018663775|nr:hypothetical protein [Vibrio navarrensis]MBE3652450.1 hypothetical protein [Vibrio navarrensis]
MSNAETDPFSVKVQSRLMTNKLVGADAADLDGDGVPNSRDKDYNPEGDADGDGISNKAEYDSGSDPLDPNSPMMSEDEEQDGEDSANDVEQEVDPNMDTEEETHEDESYGVDG